MTPFDLAGHEAAWREWRAAMSSARMHHGWILAGPKGMGKGTFARAAQRLGVTRTWLRRHGGRLPFATKLAHRTVRYSASGLERWLAARRA